MENPENLKTKIFFKNQPKLSGHEVDSKKDKLKVMLVPLIEEFVVGLDRFKNENVEVSFSEEGVSSLVSVLETSKERCVLKINLDSSYSSAEARFLNVWREAGVSVPEIFAEGLIGGQQYILMEYVDAPTLSRVRNIQDLVKMEVYLELGQIFHQMHEPEAQGYGRVVDGLPEFDSFRDWLQSEDVEKRLAYVRGNGFLGAELESILSSALKILLLHTEGDHKSSYCHDDFGLANTFATKPLTIFDPNSRFNNPYLDLGRTIAVMTSDDESGPAISQLLDGYFGDKPYDKKFLFASIVLNACFKFRYWHQKKKEKRLRNMGDYILRNKDILVS